MLDTEGYAECPDCGAKIHCGTVGLKNLEKRHQGSKICLETKAKRDKTAKLKKNGSLLTFFNRPKPMLLPSTISGRQLVQSPALPQGKGSTSAAHAQGLGDQQAPIPIVTHSGTSTFIEMFIDLAKNLPETIPEASDNDKLAEFGGDPANFDDMAVDKDQLWEEEINPCLKMKGRWKI